MKTIFIDNSSQLEQAELLQKILSLPTKKDSKEIDYSSNDFNELMTEQEQNMEFDLEQESGMEENF